MKRAITDAEFYEVLKSDKLVVVQFHAHWCQPCKVVGPRLDEIAETYGDEIEVVSIDIDDNQETAAKLGIRNIPTVIMFKGGESVYKELGTRRDYIPAIEKNK